MKHLLAQWRMARQGERNQKAVASKMYHVAPASARASIEQYGLDYSRSGRGAPVSGDGEVLPFGNYLYRTRESAEDLLANISGNFDLWEVEVDGLTLLDDPYEDYEAVYTPDSILPNRLRLGSKTADSTWRGFTEDDAPPWTLADFVILTQRRGRQRYYEVFTFGRNWRNFERLEEAKAAVEADHGPLVWRQKSMPKVWVEHYYFSWTSEFTDPLVVYLADI